MKNALLIISVLFTSIFCGCSSSTVKDKGNDENASQVFNLDTTTIKSGDTFYQCEMDTEIISDEPGNCPKCEMQLTQHNKQ